MTAALTRHLVAHALRPAATPKVRSVRAISDFKALERLRFGILAFMAGCPA